VALLLGGGPELRLPVLGVGAERGVGGGFTGDEQPGDHRQAAVPVPLLRQGPLGPFDHFPGARRPGGVNLHRGPAQDVHRLVTHLPHLPVLDPDDDTPLGPRLPDVASLKTAGINDPRIAGHDLVAVRMPQGPVLVAPAAQSVGGAGGIDVMALPAGQAGMENPNVEHSGPGRGKFPGYVVGDDSFGESPAVEDHIQLRQGDALRFSMGKDVNVIGQLQ